MSWQQLCSLECFLSAVTGAPALKHNEWMLLSFYRMAFVPIGGTYFSVSRQLRVRCFLPRPRCEVGIRPGDDPNANVDAGH